MSTLDLFSITPLERGRLDLLLCAACGSPTLPDWTRFGWRDCSSCGYAWWYVRGELLGRGIPL